MEKSLSTTRQELLRLKKQFAEIRVGYRLLEQKRDSLIKTFMELKGEFLTRKEKLFNDLKEIIALYGIALETLPISLVDFISKKYQTNIDIDVKSQSIMGVKTILFSVKEFKPPQIEDNQTSQSHIKAIKKLSSVILELIEISSLEDALIRLAGAIEKTRRRVNILRDVTMPNIQSQMKYINLKLADQERESLVFNLKFKSKKTKN
jgi:V/A-type H+-transporting ATPase subunit D